MKVEEIMSVNVETCRADDTLDQPARIMWEKDCGVVPVIDDESHVIGMITDRDICMAAYTQGRRLSEIPVSSACSRTVRSCRLEESVDSAEAVMRAAQVRRLPVVDDEGTLWGIVSLGDIAQSLGTSDRKADGLSPQNVASTLAAISQPSDSPVADGGGRDASAGSQASLR